MFKCLNVILHLTRQNNVLTFKAYNSRFHCYVTVLEGEKTTAVGYHVGSK